jgi:hypothetical protein
MSFEKCLDQVKEVSAAFRDSASPEVINKYAFALGALEVRAAQWVYDNERLQAQVEELKKKLREMEELNERVAE